MKRKAVFLSIGIITALLTLVSGCGGNSIGESLDTAGVSTGRLIVKITDAPNIALDRVMLTITGLQVHMAGSEDTEEEQEQEQNSGDTQNQENNQNQNENKGGWIDLELVNAKDGKLTFDLLEYRDGLQKLAAVADLDAGKYTQIRMEVESVKLDVAGDESSALITAKLPSGSLKFIQPFEIVGGQDTELLFDIDALKSVHQTGKDNYMFKPVIKLDVISTATLTITTPALPNGVVGSAYSATLTAVGGKGARTWSLDAVSLPLPTGLILDAATGTISGTIDASVVPGNLTFTVKVTDSSVPAKTATKTFTINIALASALQIMTTYLPDGMVGILYTDYILQAVGGNGIYTWSLVAASVLPTGLSLSPAGVISGTPTAAAGDYSFTVQVTDTSNPVQTDTQLIIIHINAAILAP